MSMHSTITYISKISLLCIACIIFPSIAMANPTKTIKSTHINTTSFEITQELKKFNELNDIAALTNATNLVTTMNKDVNDLDSKKFYAGKLTLWLSLLNSIDTKLDPKFNPNDLPALNAIPPDGAQIPVGASPSAIKDPELREKYIKNIQANQDKTEAYNFQYRLQELNKQTTGEAREYIAKSHLRNVLDKNEFIKVVNQIVVAPHRKKLLLSYATAKNKIFQEKLTTSCGLVSHL